MKRPDSGEDAARGASGPAPDDVSPVPRLKLNTALCGTPRDGSAARPRTADSPQEHVQEHHRFAVRAVGDGGGAAKHRKATASDGRGGGAHTYVCVCGAQAEMA